MGQDLKADALLSSSKTDIRLVLPSVCLMEAISAFDWKRIERNRLKDELDRQLIQLQRSINVQAAQELATELTQADLTNTKLLSELFQRLDDYVVRVTERAELVPVSADVVRREVQIVNGTELDRADALILASVLSHSEDQPEGKKAFLTGDIKDFLKQPVRVLLASAGIKLLSSSENALGWALGTK